MTNSGHVLSVVTVLTAASNRARRSVRPMHVTTLTSRRSAAHAAGLQRLSRSARAGFAGSTSLTSRAICGLSPWALALLTEHSRVSGTDVTPIDPAAGRESSDAALTAIAPPDPQATGFGTCTRHTGPPRLCVRDA